MQFVRFTRPKSPYLSNTLPASLQKEHMGTAAMDDHMPRYAPYTHVHTYTYTRAHMYIFMSLK